MRRGRRQAAALFLAAFALRGMPAAAQIWHFEPSVSLQETLTSNVNLEPSNIAKGDLVTQLTPQLNITEKGARTKLRGFVAVPILLYARTGAENNTVYPSVDLLGDVAVVEKFFVVEGAVNVSQQFFTPFGARPTNLVNATQNQYTAATYRVSPYIQGATPGDIKYLLRNDNIWTNLNGAPETASNAYYDQWTGNVSSPVAPFGWAVDYNRSDVKFTDQPPTTTELARGRLLYQVTPQLRVDLAGGYEENHYPLTTYRGPIYGAGFLWNPTERTIAVGNVEHRFFGASYLFAFDHRTPRSATTVRASRNTSSYPQQFLSLPATGNVPLLLNFLLRSRIPDPVERLEVVNRLIEDRGLPNVLTNPVNLYTEQTYLLENASVTVGLLGARNNVFTTIFYARTQPISGAGNPLPGIFAASNNNTQSGATVTWTHNLTALVTLDASATALRTTANAPLVGTTNQGAVSLGLRAPLSAKTIVFAGARYQVLHSDVTNDYNEAAIFAGITYTFR